MNLEQDKVWKTINTSSSIHITFWGKHADGVKGLTFALIGLALLFFTGLIVFSFASPQIDELVIIFLVVLLIFGFFLNWITANTNYEVEITKDILKE